VERELIEECEGGDPGPVAPEKIHMLKELCIFVGRFSIFLQGNMPSQTL
jgi:hypothetical protein